MAKGPTRNMQIKTLAILLGVTLLFFGTAIGRLGFLVFVKGEEYAKAAANQQLRDVTLTAKRGKIYDKNMNILADSASVWLVNLTPKNLKTDEDRETVARALSEILQVDFEKILNMAKKNSAYEIVKRGVEQPQADLVREFIRNNSKYASAVGLDESSKRYYPNDNLLSTVLGFVGSDNQGLSGLEYYYDKVLRGTGGRVISAKNAWGEDMPFQYETRIEAKPGNSLMLTVDKYIQHFAEKYLEQAVIENKVTGRGSVIVMDVNTGGILAMATKPDFNPNEPMVIYDKAARTAVEAISDPEERKKALGEAQQTQWRNKSVSEVYEPGSVFKIITGASALEEGVIGGNSRFYCPGYIKVANRTIRCHHTSGHGSQTLAEAFQNSCNPAFIETGQKLGIDKFYKYFRAFGLSEKTGIDLPGEETPVLHAKPGIVELASTSFGQTFKITPIQLITAISAVVNGGHLVQPHLVASEVDENGNVVKQHETSVSKRQVISQETAEKMRVLLENVVKNGSGRNAYVAGYRIAGKTGTSQKVAEEAQGQKKTYIGSFCGIAPADKPQIAVLLTLDTPNVPIYYGGTIAAPAVGRILSQVLPYLGVEPVYTQEELAKLDVKTPNLMGKTVEEAKSILSKAGLEARIVGSGSEITRQLPTLNQSVPKGGTVVLYTEVNTEKTMVKVPRLTGLSVTAVNKTAANVNLNVKFSGTSLTTPGILSYAQSIPEGTEVEAGTIITVDFRVTDHVE